MYPYPGPWYVLILAGLKFPPNLTVLSFRSLIRVAPCSTGRLSDPPQPRSTRAGAAAAMDFGGPSWLQPIATVGILAALYLFFSQRRRRAEPQLARGNPPRPRSSAEGSAHQPPGAASFPSHDGGVIKTSVILDAAARKGEGAKETARREGSAARREDMQARAAAAAEARAAPRRPPPAPPSACRGEDVSTRKGGSSPIVGDTQPKDSQAPGEQGGAKHAADAEKRLSVAKASGVLSSLSGMSEDSVMLPHSLPPFPPTLSLLRVGQRANG